ncbi:MAG: hypothetical protein NTU84_01125, partial [Verrucomicrobia bacterium]|nr:hypothetical protein [Verrucomicrobiota bacterium]
MPHAHEQQSQTAHAGSRDTDQVHAQRRRGVHQALAQFVHGFEKVASIAAQTRSAASGMASERAAAAMRSDEAGSFKI